MNIREIKLEKEKLEKEINVLINDKLNAFARLTDIYIDSIDISLGTIEYIGNGSGVPYCYYADTKLRIEL